MSKEHLSDEEIMHAYVQYRAVELQIVNSITNRQAQKQAGYEFNSWLMNRRNEERGHWLQFIAADPAFGERTKKRLLRYAKFENPSGFEL